MLAVGGLQAQQVESRIAGLEGNAEYMSLLREDAQLQMREDSVVNAVEGFRRQLRENPAERQRHSQEILKLESGIFEIRNAKGRLVDRINTIEQDWVFANLNDGKSSVAGVVVSGNGPLVLPDSLKVRSLIDNHYFREHLPAADYAALRKAQQMEMHAVDYVNRYFANYMTISDLAERYAAVPTEAEALDLYGKYATLQGLNRVLADSLAGVWNYVFDNKSYAYGYMLDKLDKDEVLAREEERMAEAARQLTALRGEVVSDVVADYFLRKQVLVDYEIAVAGVLRLDTARDSLKGVVAQLKNIDFRLPKVDVQERYFLDYEPLKFPAVSQYSYKHPIPECRVYAKGMIYRILLGTFNTKRAVATFRGTEPLCYQVGEDGKWSYYAGGFATKEEAEDARKILKSRGFMRPEIVVWADGESRNITRDPTAQTVGYRVEIAGVAALSDAVKAVIAQGAEGTEGAEGAKGRELSRVGPQMFVVGLFDDKALADRLADAIRQTDGALEIKVAEIAVIAE